MPRSLVATYITEITDKHGVKLKIKGQAPMMTLAFKPAKPATKADIIKTTKHYVERIQQGLEPELKHISFFQVQVAVKFDMHWRSGKVFAAGAEPDLFDPTTYTYDAISGSHVQAEQTEFPQFQIYILPTSAAKAHAAKPVQGEIHKSKPIVLKFD